MLTTTRENWKKKTHQKTKTNKTQTETTKPLVPKASDEFWV